MTSERNILLGRITRVHGFEGAVNVKLDKQFSENLTEKESVFLEIEGKLVPFFIEYIEPTSPGFIRMKFEGYDSVSEVQEFTGCSIFDTGKLPQKKNGGLQLKDLIGYLVISENMELGKIIDIIENPGQFLLEVVNSSGNSILIPFHEDLIIGIDPESENVTMILPEGLADIN